MSAEQFMDSIWATTESWPKPSGRAIKNDGRSQGGQLAAVLGAHPQTKAWGDRPLRAVFTFIDPLQASLGRPNREQVVTTRPQTMTTLEAIHLANGPILAGHLNRAATSLQKRHENEDGTMMDFGIISVQFWRAFGTILGSKSRSNNKFTAMIYTNRPTPSRVVWGQQHRVV